MKAIKTLLVTTSININTTCKGRDHLIPHERRLPCRQFFSMIFMGGTNFFWGRGKFAPKIHFALIFIKKKIGISFDFLFVYHTNPPPPPLRKSNGSPLSRQHFVFVVLIKMCFQYASHSIGISQVV